MGKFVQPILPLQVNYEAGDEGKLDLFSLTQQLARMAQDVKHQQAMLSSMQILRHQRRIYKERNQRIHEAWDV
mgnify:CR=1 FL=1